MQWINHTHTGSDSHMNSISLGQLLFNENTTWLYWNFVIFNVMYIAISETARWKNIIPVSYCRAAQELLNGVWILGIELNCGPCYMGSDHDSATVTFNFNSTSRAVRYLIVCVSRQKQLFLKQDEQVWSYSDALPNSINYSSFRCQCSVVQYLQLPV